jgi:glycosyltransferase involved in cell wall biosynthesis
VSQQQPLLSIVIPCYNVRRFIHATVESALGQTYGNLEVIVVDDGSTDGTAELLEEVKLSRNDARLIVINQANAGVGTVRNTGVSRAQGEYVGFLDSDDVWHPEKAARQIEVMERDPTIAITFSQSLCIDENGQPTGARLEPKNLELKLYDLLLSNQIGNGSTPIIRRNCLDAVGLFRTDINGCEDYDMWARILSIPCVRAVQIPLPLTSYRIHAASATFHFDPFLEVAERTMKYLRQDLSGINPMLWREGHAEHYRFIAWKAATTGHRLQAARFMAKAMAICPWLFFTGRRPWGTLAAIVLPSAARDALQSTINSARRKIAGRDASLQAIDSRNS